jgi:uncharacterized membrane protein YfcA
VNLVLVAATIAVAALLQSASGFGFSLIAVPVISILVGARTAVVATDTLAFVLIGSLVIMERRRVQTGSLRLVTASALVGMPMGLWILTHVGDRPLAIVIASVVIVLTLALMFGLAAPERAGIDVLAGFTSGVLATSTGTNGPPLVLALHARGVPPAEFRATLAAAFALQDVVAMIGFGITGHFTAAVWRVVAAGLPALLVGRLVGERVFARLDQRRFRAVVLGVLLATGVISLVEALIGG